MGVEYAVSVSGDPGQRAENVNEVRRLLVLYLLDHPEDRELTQVAVHELRDDQAIGTGVPKDARALLIEPPDGLLEQVLAEEWSVDEWRHWHLLSRSFADRGVVLTSNGSIDPISVSAYRARDWHWLRGNQARAEEARPILTMFDAIGLALGSEIHR